MQPILSLIYVSWARATGNRRRLALVAGLILMAAGRPVAAENGDSTDISNTWAQVGEFIVFSDLHYDGVDEDTGAYPGQHHDANLHLVNEALADARMNCPHPLFILNLGDNLLHERPPGFDPISVEGKLAARFHDVFENTQVFTVLGNNDFGNDSLDHRIQTRAFLTAFTNAWENDIYGTYRDEFAQTYSSQGCYVVNLPGLGNRELLVLNSAYFDQAATTNEDAAIMMCRWLKGMMTNDRLDGSKKKFWLAFHIPPGVDAYRADKAKFWDTNSEAVFLRTLARHPDDVAAIFCGHTHQDEFRVITFKDRPMTFVHFAPSVSRYNYNNPAYQVFLVDTNTGDLLDCVTHYLPIARDGAKARWTKEYSFAETYCVTNYSRESLASVHAHFCRDTQCFQETYGVYYSVSNSGLRDVEGYRTNMIIRVP